jgi:hypothetical protein
MWSMIFHAYTTHLSVPFASTAFIYICQSSLQPPNSVCSYKLLFISKIPARSLVQIMHIIIQNNPVDRPEGGWGLGVG